MECKKKVAQVYPDLDLKDIIELDDEGEEEEEEAEVAKIWPEEVVVSGAIAEEETTMEEAIIKAIADVKAMVTKVVEDSRVAQASVPEE